MNSNVWPGQQNGQNSGGMWPGQLEHPAWPSQPLQPVWPGQPQQPGWPGQLQPPQNPGPWPVNPPTAPQQVPPKVPYERNLPNGVHDKMLITIKGEVKPNPDKFTVDLSGGKDIAFHLNPRFNDHGKKVIVRNSLVHGKWGKEERALSDFPFAAGQPFELKILCTPTEYKVAVNKAHLLEFKHRMTNLKQVTHLSIYNDVNLTSVDVENLP